MDFPDNILAIISTHESGCRAKTGSKVAKW
jgi:hypothetical protein